MVNKLSSQTLQFPQRLYDNVVCDCLTGEEIALAARVCKGFYVKVKVLSPQDNKKEWQDRRFKVKVLSPEQDKRLWEKALRNLKPVRLPVHRVESYSASNTHLIAECAQEMHFLNLETGAIDSTLPFSLGNHNESPRFLFCPNVNRTQITIFDKETMASKEFAFSSHGSVELNAFEDYRIATITSDNKIQLYQWNEKLERIDTCPPFSMTPQNFWIRQLFLIQDFLFCVCHKDSLRTVICRNLKTGENTTLCENINSSYDSKNNTTGLYIRDRNKIRGFLVKEENGIKSVIVVECTSPLDSRWEDFQVSEKYIVAYFRDRSQQEHFVVFDLHLKELHQAKAKEAFLYDSIVKLDESHGFHIPTKSIISFPKARSPEPFIQFFKKSRMHVAIFRDGDELRVAAVPSEVMVQFPEGRSITIQRKSAETVTQQATAVKPIEASVQNPVTAAIEKVAEKNMPSTQTIPTETIVEVAERQISPIALDPAPLQSNRFRCLQYFGEFLQRIFFAIKRLLCCRISPRE